jgi:capsule polysaccharide export protein KpsC/LpsZ
VNEYAATSDYVFCLQANVHDLIAGSRGVFTINSGVGFESLIHGKPVVTFGNCDYRWVTFGANRERLDDAREFVGGYTDELRREANRFIYYYFFHHALSIEGDYITESESRLTDYLARETGK